MRRGLTGARQTRLTVGGLLRAVVPVAAVCGLVHLLAPESGCRGASAQSEPFAGLAVLAGDHDATVEASLAELARMRPTGPSSEVGSHFLVVCPYETAASIQQRLGFSWDDADDVARDHGVNDGLQTLVRVRAGAVVSYEQTSRGRVDLCAGAHGAWPLLAADTPLLFTRSEPASTWTATTA